MVNKLHDGLTISPDATLPDGTREVEIKGLFKKKLSFAEIIRQLEFKFLRALNKNFHLAVFKNQKFLSGEILKTISSNRKNGPVVCVMAPWFEDPTLSKSEGYIRRVMEIDRRVLDGFFRIYFYECPYHRVFRITADRLNSDVIYIRYNSRYKNQLRFIERIIAECDVCYSHSVLRIIPDAGPQIKKRWPDIFKGRPEHILDVHGAAVEEGMIQDDPKTPYIAEAERLYFNSVGNVVVLSGSMSRYFTEKYDCADITFIITPVISGDFASDDKAVLSKDGSPAVVYSGGCQVWQNIPEIQHAVKSRLSYADYYLYVTQPDVFMKFWGYGKVPANVLIKNGNHDEIQKTYQSAHYGFILRDDNTLNRVACPTKIMEYIQFGIIPIMKFADIGDFVKSGLNYIPVESFTDGILPDETERRIMARENLCLFNKLKSDYISAVCELKALIKEDTKNK